MTIAVLPSYTIHGSVKFPARLKQRPVKYVGQIKRTYPKRPPTHSDTFIRPDNPSFIPLIYPTLRPQQNFFNALPDPEVNLSYDIDQGLPLNPFKKTTFINSASK